jgi:hypothetical protein
VLGSKIAWRIFERDSNPDLQDDYEHTIKLVQANGFYPGTSSIQLYEGIEYCLRVYKGSTTDFGSSKGSNQISVLSGTSTTLASISVTTPKQYLQCFKTPGSACPSPGGEYGEKYALATTIGPFDSYTVKTVSDEAWSVSNASGLPGQYDGEQDAFRHCYFSCRTTQQIGSSQAEAAGDIHENCFFNGWPERTKDQFNNMKGREFGSVGGTDCKKRCFDATKKAELKIKV